MLKNLSTAAVVIGVLKVKLFFQPVFLIFVCLVCGLESQSTALVMSRLSVNLT